MTARLRPIHSSFETLRLAGLTSRPTSGFNRFGMSANEQMTATGYSRIMRPAQIHTDFIQR